MTTSSTWSFESRLPLGGCGVDLERVARFEPVAADATEGWSLVFSARELAHARAASHPAWALCASFCCKEALTKALRVPFEYAECELLFDPKASEQELCLGPTLRREHGVTGCKAFVQQAEGEQCLAVVYVFGAAP